MDKERKRLFQHLNTVLDVSEKKFSINNKQDYARLKWGRLIIQAVNSYGKLLETIELDQLMKEIEAIKKHIGMS